MRYLITAAGLLSIVAALGSVKYLQISSLIGAAHAAEKAGPPPESVSTARSKEDSWPQTFRAVGSIIAAKGVTISNDAAGIVTNIYFESGARVRPGQVLLELDHGVERAQLTSARARQELAETTAGRSRTLTSSGVVPKTQLESDEATLKTSNADIDALQAQIARKIVRAPFAGQLGIRQINLGQYLNPGTPVVVLEAIDSVFVDFSLPQQQLSNVALGMTVRTTVSGTEETAIEGRLSAIDPAIDSTTRSIKLRATIPNGKGLLRPGMFADVDLVLPQELSVVAVPATAIVHASYGDSVFVVEDKKLEPGSSQVSAAMSKPTRTVKQHFVRVGKARGDFVAIVEGLRPDEEVITEGAFKLRNGASIVINNEAPLTPRLTPHPENH